MHKFPEKVRKTVRELVKTSNSRTLSGEKHEIQGTDGVSGWSTECFIFPNGRGMKGEEQNRGQEWCMAPQRENRSPE